METESISAQRDYVHPSIVLGTITLLVHLAFNGGYDTFSDELYFIVCGQHPAFGYVDQPPLIPLIAATSYAWFGLALLPLRIVPALAMAATVGLACAFTRALGGGRFAQWLCGLAVLGGGAYLVDGYLLTTDCLQPLTWLACCWCVVRIAQTKDERWWLAFGAIAGISFESKYLIAFLPAALLPGLLLTPLRRSFLRPWIYFAALIALACAAPNIWWQGAHGWPFLELQKTDTSIKNLVLSPLAFLAQQILFVGPVATPVWLAGLWQWSRKPSLPELRAFPMAFAVLEVLLYVLHGKTYYAVPFFPVFIAAGTLAIEQWVKWPVPRWSIVGIVAAIGLVLAPLTLPVLAPDHYAAYAHTLGLQPRSASTEKADTGGALPLHMAGQFGWREITARVSAIYNALPPDERARTIFYGRDYGEAAGAALYGESSNGPPVVSAHNNFFFWGPGTNNGYNVIVLAGDVAPLMKNYRTVRIVGHVDNRFGEPWERNLPVYLLSGPRVPLRDLWQTLKYFE